MTRLADFLQGIDGFVDPFLFSFPLELRRLIACLIFLVIVFSNEVYFVYFLLRSWNPWELVPNSHY